MYASEKKFHFFVRQAIFIVNVVDCPLVYRFETTEGIDQS
jgi:hypothetical protein